MDYFNFKRRSFPYRYSLVCLLFAANLCKPTPAFADTVYKVGVVPQFNSRKVFSIWKPIITELEKSTGLKFKLVGTTKIPNFENEYLNGEFDFAYMNPYLMLKGHNRQGYIPLVRDVGRSLYGIVVVRKDSPISKVEELNGKLVAFPSANAMGASLVPRSDFNRIYNIKVIPRYVKTHTSVYLNVFKGLTVAGGGVQNTLDSQNKIVKQNLRVIYKTKTFAPHPIAAHPRVPERHRIRVKNALLELGKTKKGAALLSKIPITRIGEAGMKDYRVMEEFKLDEFTSNE